jgi:hypothetical protein
MKPTLRPSARGLVFLAIISLLTASSLYFGYSITTTHTAAKTHQVKEAAGKNEPYSTTYKTTTEVVLKQIPAQKDKTTAKTKVKEVARKNETNSTTYKTTTEVVLQQIPAQKDKTTFKTQVKEVARNNETNSTTYKTSTELTDGYDVLSSVNTSQPHTSQLSSQGKKTANETIILLINNVSQIHIKSANILSAANPPRLFECGYRLTKLSKALFSDLEPAGEYHRGAPSSSQDILLFGMGGACDGTQFRIRPDYVEENFQGKALFVNGEPHSNLFPLGNYPKSTEHLFQMGSISQGTQSTHPRALRVFYAAIILWEKFGPREHAWIFDHAHKRHYLNKRPIGFHLRNSVIYMAGNCVDHRQQAASQLSIIVPVHFARCKPTDGNESNVHIIPESDLVTPAAQQHWADNYKLYSNYKYCLCMENRYQPGYISEKLLLAFLGGCLPIYWGTEEVLEVFNPEAFIFYDIKNPQSALNRVRQLQANETAYRQVMLEAPILKNGNVTIEEFFSLSETIGNGTLRRKIRNMLGMAD